MIIDTLLNKQYKANSIAYKVKSLKNNNLLKIKTLLSDNLARDIILLLWAFFFAFKN